MSASDQSPASPRKLSYGWIIVAAMLVVQTVSSGLGFYNMSVYVLEFSQALSAPLASLSFAVSLFFVTGGIAGIYVARQIGRVDIRWIMIIGAFIGGLTLAGMNLATEVWHLYLLFALFGAGNTGVSLVVATTLITRWFPGPDRSIALSIASTGLSLGGVVFTPLTAYLFNTQGVFETMPWLGLAFFLFTAPVAWLVVRLPDEVQAFEVAAGSETWSYHAAVRTRFFILLATGYVLCMGAQVGGIAHLYGRVEMLGGYASASIAVQVLSVCSILGRFAGGVIITRVPIRYFTLAMLLMQCVGVVVIGMAPSADIAFVGTALFGLSVGNLLMSQPLWLAEAFPGELYPRVFALANALSVIGVALGPFVMGLSVDAVGYPTAFSVACGLGLLAFFVLFAAGSNPHEHRREPT